MLFRLGSVPSVSQPWLFRLMVFLGCGAIIVSLSAATLLSGLSESNGYTRPATLLTAWRHGNCPTTCPADPFALPGMLKWPHTSEAMNETRWIPFTNPDLEGSDDTATTSFLPLKLVPAEDTLDVPIETAPSFTAELNRGFGGPEERQWDWLRDRLVLFVDDRNNVDQLCGQIGGQYTNLGGHKFGSCHVSRLNLTIVNWFLFGMLDEEESEIIYDEAPFTFERRIEEIMLPTMDYVQVNRRPDLVVLASLFWDERFLTQYNDRYVHRERHPTLGLFHNEVNWYRNRIKEFIQFFRRMYGEDVPIMLRTRQHRLNQQWGAGLRIYQLDQGARSVAKALGVKLFTWGEKLEGYNEWVLVISRGPMSELISSFYDKDQHFGLGPNTYLFGE